MWELIELGARSPHIPIFMGIILYCWISLGSFMIGKPDLAVMWFAYAIANGAMFWHYVR